MFSTIHFYVAATTNFVNDDAFPPSVEIYGIHELIRMSFHQRYLDFEAYKEFFNKVETI